MVFGLRQLAFQNLRYVSNWEDVLLQGRIGWEVIGKRYSLTSHTLSPMFFGLTDSRVSQPKLFCSSTVLHVVFGLLCLAKATKILSNDVHMNPHPDAFVPNGPAEPSSIFLSFDCPHVLVSSCFPGCSIDGQVASLAKFGSSDGSEPSPSSYLNRTDEFGHNRPWAGKSRSFFRLTYLMQIPKWDYWWQQATTWCRYVIQFYLVSVCMKGSTYESETCLPNPYKIDMRDEMNKDGLSHVDLKRVQRSDVHSRFLQNCNMERPCLAT